MLLNIFSQLCKSLPVAHCNKVEIVIPYVGKVQQILFLVHGVQMAEALQN